MQTRSNLLVRDEQTGAQRDATPQEIITAAKAHLAARMKRGAPLDSPTRAKDYVTVRYGAAEHETFSVIHLDNRHRVIEFQELFRGTIDGATVAPREVVKEALRRNTAAVIFVHNHPSGVAEPSHADEMITQRLKAALGLVDIRVIDHLIVAGSTVVSFEERGIL